MFCGDTLCVDLKYHWWELPQVSFLSRHAYFCRDKHVFCRDKSMLVATNTCFVATKIFCRDKRNFVATKLAYFCRDKNGILVAAPANDTEVACGDRYPAYYKKGSTPPIPCSTDGPIRLK